MLCQELEPKGKTLNANGVSFYEDHCQRCKCELREDEYRYCSECLEELDDPDRDRPIVDLDGDDPSEQKV